MTQRVLHPWFDYQPAPSVLGAVCFGVAHPSSATSFSIHTGLHALSTPGCSTPMGEWLQAQGAIQYGELPLKVGSLRYAQDDAHLLAELLLPEAQFTDLTEAADYAYRRFREFNQQSGFTHVLRVWNYLDRINEGVGDAERYRRFCVGRARGFADSTLSPHYPAASAIGRKQDSGMLQVYWLAAKQPGITLENPRQLSAWQYPREYGPASPSFARACLLPGGPLLISGTASIVGHQTLHAGDVAAQLQETLNNLQALISHARTQHPELPAQLGDSSLLKIYVRHTEQAPVILSGLRQQLGTTPKMLLLHADICRSDLLLEIDCIHGLPAANATSTTKA